MQDNFSGRHLIMDVVTDNIDLLKNISVAESYMYEVTAITKMQLVIPVISMKFPFNSELVGMVRKLQLEGTDSPIIKEYVKYVDMKEKEDVGVSSIGLWNTSHCSSHSWAEHNYISIDLYSCLNFDPYPVIEFTKEHYQVKRNDIVNMQRFIGQPQIISQLTLEY